MWKIEFNKEGTPVPVAFKRSDEDLACFSFRHLAIYLPLNNPICSRIIRCGEYYTADYICEWNGFNSKEEWTTVYVGLREKKGQLNFYAICPDETTFHYEAVDNEVTDNLLASDDELKFEYQDELYHYHNPKYLVRNVKKPHITVIG